MTLFTLSHRSRTRCATLALLTIVVLGCSDDDNPARPTSSSTMLTGAYVEAHQGGYLYSEYMRITIATNALAPVRPQYLADPIVVAQAELTPWTAPAIFTVRGTYNKESRMLNLSEQSYTFVGEYEAESSTILGTATSSVSPAIFACAVDGLSAARFYCGTFESENQIPARLWRAVIAGARLHGVRSGTPADNDAFSGTVSGTDPSRTIAVQGDLGDGAILRATGTLDTETGQISGPYTIEQNGASLDSGTWLGARCTTADIKTPN